MRYDNVKQLKSKIKELQKENEFLQKGIDSREDAHNYVCEQRDKAMVYCQEITFLLLYMESIQAMTMNDNSTNAKTIKRAIGKFKQELTDGFASNHLVIQLRMNNKLDKSGINNTTNEKEI